LISKAEAEYMAFKIAKCYRPQSEMLYTGENDDQVYFEVHMEKMERYLDGIPDITERIKLEELEYWFSGMAGKVVRSLAVGEDDTERLAMAKNEKLMEGEPFARSDFEGIRGFLINLLKPYYQAERMGQSWVFGRESTYHGLLRAKLPHMIS
jgi:hypothetical protein